MKKLLKSVDFLELFDIQRESRDNRFGKIQILVPKNSEHISLFKKEIICKDIKACEKNIYMIK